MVKTVSSAFKKVAKKLGKALVKKYGVSSKLSKIASVIVMVRLIQRVGNAQNLASLGNDKLNELEENLSIELEPILKKLDKRLTEGMSPEEQDRLHEKARRGEPLD